MNSSALESISDYVNANFIEDGDLGPSDPLKDNEQIDSIKMLELILFLEEEFEIEVADDDIVTSHHFATMSNLAVFVEGKRAAFTEN
jgi:acyl carrier protein